MSPGQHMTLTDWHRLIRRNYPLLLGSAFAAMLVALAGSFLLKPVYESKVLLKVDPTSSQSLLAAATPAWWYDPTPLFTQVELARSETVLERVCTKLKLNPDIPLATAVEKLRRRVRASVVRNTSLISVTVTDNERERVRDIANSLGAELVAISVESRQKESRQVREFLDSQVLKVRDDLIQSEVNLSPRAIRVNEEVYRLLLSRRHEANIAEHSQIGEIRIVDPATLPVKPVRPRKIINGLVGTFLGLMVGLAGALWREQQIKGVASVEELEEAVSTPVLGWVSQYKFRPGSDWLARPGGVLGEHEGDGRLDQYRMIAGNLELLPADQKRKSLLVTSAVPGEGKSRTVACLGLAMAKQNRRVVVVEGDMRRPMLSNLWKLSGPGFAEVLAGKCELAESLRVLDPSAPYFCVLPAGSAPPDPTDLLDGERLEGILSQLKDEFDAVLVDSSPVLLTHDAMKLAGVVDGILMIVEAETTPKKTFIRTLRQLERIDSKMRGMILNKLPVDSTPYGSYYGRYYGSKRAASVEAG